MKSRYATFISHLYRKLLDAKDQESLKALRIWEAGLSGDVPDSLKRHHEEYTLRYPDDKGKYRDRERIKKSG
jgi:hypothetical protein